MNFLSHFYFENKTTDPNMVMGVVLPDFIKNAQKDCNLYPQKTPDLFQTDLNEQALLMGWQKHVEVDRLFHSSGFFQLQTNHLKQMLLPVLEESPVKPFFLAHIGLELILDHLLTIEGIVNISTFYDQLVKSDKPALDQFLNHAGLTDTTVFFKFLKSFISSRYLFSYRKIENITYALNRICMRLWDTPFTDDQLTSITAKLEVFKHNIKDHYLSIFDEIERDLQSGKS
jgi:acyl carrier protein phosphodiesterase